MEKQHITMPEILNIGDIADLLRVSEQTARRYITDGKIPACRIVYGKYLVSRDQLVKFIEDHTS